MCRHSTLTSVFIGILLGSVVATSQADDCDAVYNAGIKSVRTPHHMFITTTHSAERMAQSDKFRRLTGKPMYAGRIESSEAIFDGKTEYLQVHGTWRRSPMSPADMLAGAEEKLRTRPDTCVAKGEQSVDGQAVDVYMVRGNEGGSAQQLRIFRSGGLLQGDRSTQSDGSIVEARYAYDDVHAPDGVR